MRFAVLSLLLLTSPAIAQPKLPNYPGDLMAPTDALSPADERKAFTVPAGFDVQLVASEPDIQKPIQMAFDAKGRLWVTTSYHYPFAAPGGKGTDKLFVLSDFDASGKAKKVQVFASDLNIPIGILPLPDCNSCIVSSVGEIRKYTDTTGNGKADKMEVLYSGFGFRDTHGMYNSYTLMPDGWVYACHGFSNDSTVKGKDGHEVKMQSGNTFRFRPDGSRIEVYTRGQVNPFGIAIDPWFNLYTADCHSKPITQLIPGGYYDSFGKPHDGLGYAPHVVHHDHGSTALCGLTWYDANQFPPEYLSCMFLGNVVTNRINFDKIQWKGASPVGIEQPDFLVSKDRWFRPVDIKLGPDGALYVSDFYNKIIGHYEVPLNDPRRDKDRGRIWRIVWKGKDGNVPAPKFHRADFTKATNEELFSDLFHPNLTVRFLAGNQLRQRVVEGKELALGETATKLLENRDRMASVVGWLAFLAEAGKEPVPVSWYEKVVKDAKGLKPELLTGQVVRALSSRAKWGEGERAVLLDIFKSFNSVHQQFAAVQAVIFHPHAEFVQPVLEILKKCPPEDTHMRQAAKIALRNCLRDDGKAWPKDYDPIYADMALAIPNQNATAYLLLQIQAKTITGDRLALAAEHVARYSTDLQLVELLGWINVRRTDPDPVDPNALLGLFRGLQSAGKHLPSSTANAIIAQMDGELRKDVPADAALHPDNVNRLLGVTRVLSTVSGLVQTRMDIVVRADTVTALTELVSRPGAPLGLRGSAAEALMRLEPQKGVAALRKIMNDPNTSPATREKLLEAFAASSDKDARLDARDSLKDAPYRTAVAVGAALAGTPPGADDLLTAVKTGKAPARLLQEQAILERLKAAKIPDLDKQIAALTKGLPPLDQRLAELIKKRATAFASAKPDKELGAKIFTKHCAACHRIGDQGGKIAPQLDGIGVRGLERILEDTLDPNRNVDQAFRARIITTKDEQTITGLMLRVEGKVVVMANHEGKEIRIPEDQIALNRETMLSPMPANFGDIIPEADFMHLIAYLLDQKAPALKKE
jgi:putative heme-binding domain-containing protein